MVEILVSPGFGAGWSSWSEGSVALFALGYRPLIDAIKRGEAIWTESDERNYSLSLRDDAAPFVPSHPAMRQFYADLKARFGEDDSYFYPGGARDLSVKTIDDDCLFRINEYDGNESVEVMSADNFIPASAIASAQKSAA